MIITRGHFDPDDVEIVGDGPFIIAMEQDELELISALLGLVRLGHNQYQRAALRLMNSIEAVSADADFFSYALDQVQPVIEVFDDTRTVMARYDKDSDLEIVV